MIAKLRFNFSRITAALVLCFGVSWTVAQNYPARSVKLVVPYAAGQGTDVAARFLAEQLSKAIGQNRLVENRPGAGGNIGELIAAAQAKPGKINVAYTTTSSRATLELFKAQARAPHFGISYKGSAQAIGDVIGEQIEFMVDTVASIRTQVSNGKMKALGVTSPNASETMKIMALSGTRQKLLQLGIDPRAMSGSDLKSFLKSEREKWGEVIRSANIKAD